MPHRSRSELLDFICLILDLPPPPPLRHRTIEALAVDMSIDRGIVDLVLRSGLAAMRSPGDGHPGYGPDDARALAIVERVVGLGADDAWLAALADAIETRCVPCSVDRAKERCHTLTRIEELLAQLEATVRTDDKEAVQRTTAVRYARVSVERLRDLS
jgi:hypothetical protein